MDIQTKQIITDTELKTTIEILKSDRDKVKALKLPTDSSLAVTLHRLLQGVTN